MREKTADELRRWRNPRLKAFKNFINVVGDKSVSKLTADDMLNFREWLFERIEAGLSVGSANKDLIHVSSVLKKVNKMKRLNLDLALSGYAFQKEKLRKIRPPFSQAFIQTRLLSPGALGGLNKQARCILLGMVNTGYRLGEGSALTADTIRLDHNIPHIKIQKTEKKNLKTENAERIIPLAGISLEAFRECKDGFPRYAGKPGLSATINKFLRENDLLETSGHTAYCLRHSFEDRLLDAGVDDTFNLTYKYLPADPTSGITAKDKLNYILMAVDCSDRAVSQEAGLLAKGLVISHADISNTVSDR